MMALNVSRYIRPTMLDDALRVNNHRNQIVEREVAAAIERGDVAVNEERIAAFRDARIQAEKEREG